MASHSTSGSPDGGPASPYEPKARWRHCCATVGNKLYAYGGLGPDIPRDPPTVIDVLDLETQRWEQKPTTGCPHPGPRGAACVTVGTSLYYFGGVSKQGLLNDIICCLDTETLSWSELTPRNPGEAPMAKYDFAMVSYMSMMLVMFGGYGVLPHNPQPGAECVPYPENDKHGWTNELHYFDLHQRTWCSPQTTGSRPPPCSGCSLTRVDEHRALHFGGEHLSRLVPNHIHILNLQSWSWSRVAPGPGQPWPVGRTNHYSVSLQDCNSRPTDPALMVMWGVGRGGTLSDAWIFRVNVQQWQKVILPDSLRGRFYHTTCILHCDSVQKKLVAYGGMHELPEDGKAKSVVPVSETTIVELEHTAPSGDWVVTKVIPTSELLEQPKENKDSLPKHVQMTLEEEMRHLTVADRVMRERGKIDLTVVQCMASGVPRVGKSTLLSRLTGNPPPSIQADIPERSEGTTATPEPPLTSSTGVVETPLLVTVKKAAMVVAKADQPGMIWELLTLDEEAIALLKSIVQSRKYLQTLSEPSLSNSDRAKQDSTDTTPIGGSISMATAEDQAATSGSHTEELASLFGIGRLGNRGELVPSMHFKTPLDIFKDALKSEKWASAQALLEGSLTIYVTDTGGQLEFQEILPALIAGPSVFFLVFKLTDDLNKRYQIQYVESKDKKTKPYESSFTVKEALLQSLASIASICSYISLSSEEATPVKPKVVKPKVVIIGTHKDVASDEHIEAVQKELKETLKDTAFYKEGSIVFASSNEPVVVVNNLAPGGEDAQKVREIVERIARDPSFCISVPIPWLALSLALRFRSIQALEHEECLSIALECGIQTAAELNEALWFLHTKLGVLRYYQNIPELQDVVIIDPRLIFEKITKIITTTFTFEETHDSYVEETFMQTGIFPSRVIEQITATSSELLTSKKLVKLLEYLHIISSVRDANGEVAEYFMPCILSHSSCSPAITVQQPFLPPLLVTFKCGYCPKGIFSALVAFLQSQERWHLERNGMSRDRVMFSVGCETFQTISLTTRVTHMELSISPPTDCSKCQLSEDANEICSSIRECVKGGIIAVSRTLHYSCDSEFYFGFPCTHSSCDKPAICYSESPATVSMRCKNCGVQDLTSLQRVWFGHPMRRQVDTESVASTAGMLLSSSATAVPLTIKNVTDVCDILKKAGFMASMWESLAARLGIRDPGSITHRDVDLCLQELLRQWIHNNKQTTCTWEKLAAEVSMVSGYGDGTKQAILDLAKGGIQFQQQQAPQMVVGSVPGADGPMMMYPAYQQHTQPSMGRIVLCAGQQVMPQQVGFMPTADKHFLHLQDNQPTIQVPYTLDAGVYDGGHKQTTSMPTETSCVDTAVDTATPLDHPPSLKELIRFPSGRKSRLNIPAEIGDKYMQFGVLLLDDDNGARVTSIAHEYQRNAEQINLKIFQEWLSGEGLQPVTWETLCGVLDDIGLKLLATDIRDTKTNRKQQ